MYYIPSVHNIISLHWYNIYNQVTLRLRQRSKHVAVMWPDCIYCITILIYCCVLTVYNTLYKFVNTQRDGLSLKKRYCIYLWTGENFTHNSQQNTEKKRLRDSACLIMFARILDASLPPWNGHENVAHILLNVNETKRWRE